MAPLSKIRLPLLLLALLQPLTTSAKSVDDSYLSAQQHLQAKEVRSAIIELKNALQKDPQHTPSRLLLGNTYANAGDGTVAEKELRHAIGQGATRDKWLMPLSQAMLLQGQYDQVLQEITILPADTPKQQAFIHAIRGTALTGLGQSEMAHEAFDKALALDSTQADAHLGLARLATFNSDFNTAIKLSQEVRSRNPNRIESFLLEAEALRQRGDLDKAIKLFSQGIVLQSNNVLLRMGRAAAYVSTEAFDKAEADADAVLRISQGFVPANYLKALLNIRRNDDKKAETYLQAILKRFPDYEYALLSLGTLNHRTGNMSMARDHIEKYLTIKPENLSASKLLANIYLTQNVPTEAIQLLTPLRKTNPGDIELTVLAGRAYLKSGNTTRGTELLQKAVDQAPNNSTLHAQLAIGKIHSGDVDSAIIELENAVALNPELFKVDVMLVMTLLEEKKVKEAVSAATALIAKRPNDPMAYNLLGSAHLARGDHNSAKVAFRKALTLDPTFQLADINLAGIAFRNDELDTAQHHYRSALNVYEKNIAAMVGLARIASAQDNPKKMLEWLERAHAAEPGDSKAATLLNQYLLEVGKPLKALAVAHTLHERSPDGLSSLRLLGTSLVATGEYDNAIHHLRRYATRAPDKADAWYLLADAEMRSGAISDALEHARRAQNLRRDHLNTMILLTRIATLEKRQRDAIKLSGKIIQTHPKSTHGYRLKGALLAQAEKNDQAIDVYLDGHKNTQDRVLAQITFNALVKAGRHNDAFKLMREWLQQHPDDHDLRIKYAMGLQEFGQPDKALDEYQTLRQAQPNNIILLNNLAWMYHERDDKRALSAAKQAFQQVTDNADIADTYGWMLISYGQIDDGITLLHKTAGRSPHRADIRYHLAVAYQKAGRTDNARKELTRLLRDHPAFPERSKAEALLNAL